MKVNLFYIATIFSLLTHFCDSAAPSTNGDCTSTASGQTVADNTVASWIGLTTGYAITINQNTYCGHESIYNFMVSYVLGSGDTSSSFSFQYYKMKYNGFGACIKDDESGTAATLAADIRYQTGTAGGAPIDPCGFSVYLGYTGS